MYCNFIYWFSNRTSCPGKGNRTTVTRGNTKHPKINSNSTPEQMCHRALLVALGLVYYVRLDTLYRIEFAEELDKNRFSIKFQTAFTEEVCT